MFRNGRRFLCDALLAAVRGKTATMSQSLHALEAHASDAGVVKAALQCVIQLDQSDADSASIANGPGRNALLTVMQAHVNDTAVKEMCCRCIANMALLEAPEDNSGDSSSSANTTSSSSSSSSTADVLVEGNAVEMVLGTMAAASRLSDKGQCWTATALLNLVMKSQEGANRAGQHNAEETIATFIERVILDDTPLLSIIALDAALGSLCRIASTSLPDNGKRLSYRYQMTTFSVVESVVSSIVFLAEKKKKRSSNSGAEGGADDGLANLERGAMHKCWEALRQICSHHPNLPIVFDVLAGAKAAPILVAECMENWSVDSKRRGQEEGEGEGALGKKTFDASIEAMTLLTARRHDLDGRSDGAVADAAAILPTDQAQYVVSSLSDGQLSSLALQLLGPSLEQFSSAEAADVSGKFLSLLINLSEHDPAVASNECVLLVRTTIERYLEASMPKDFRAALVGRCLSCAWNIANSPQGAEACRVMELPKAVDALVAATTAAAAESSSSSGGNRSVDKLGELAEKLQSKMRALITSPVYAHTKFDKPKA